MNNHIVGLIDDIIKTSEILLTRLKASNDDESLVSQSPSSEERSISPQSSPQHKELILLSEERDKKIHALFEQFEKDKINVFKEKIQLIFDLDSQLINVINLAQHNAKTKVIQLQKNKKAIDIYQKK